MSTNIFKSNQHFAMNPVAVDLPRSTFDRSHTHKTTFNSGKLIPIFLEEVLPGDTFNVKYSYLIRMSTPLFPVMDTANLDIYFFFVPTRIIWSDFQKFMGENDQAWITGQTEVIVPKLVCADNATDFKEQFFTGSLADYFGVPTNVRILGTNQSGLGINALPFRAYAKIWNDWFRDQNTQQTIFYNTNSADTDAINAVQNFTSTTFYNNVQYGKELAPVNKYNDYFTSCLPGPQKGQPVNIPLGSEATIYGKTPILTDSGFYGGNSWADNKLVLSNQTGGFVNTTTTPYITYLAQNNSDLQAVQLNGATITQTPQQLYQRQVADFGSTISTARVDLSNASTITVNELRQAFQIQKLLERDARGGTRYIEIIRSHFGVISPDARLQRSEYLGGSRQAINVEQVLQTSSTSGTSPLGQTGAFSMTVNKEDGFVKSFTEHGYIIGVCSVRVQHSYAQGLHKLWTRFRKYDYYWPALANIGEQPVFKREIFWSQNTNTSTPNATNDQVFGFNEAWADYRYKPNMTTGLFSPTSQGTLKSWTYVDNYTTAPTLSNDWIQESSANIQQTLALTNQPQFIADFYFSNLATRPMPVYSIPGLIDHN